MKNNSALFTLTGIGALSVIAGGYLLLSQNPTKGQGQGQEKKKMPGMGLRQTGTKPSPSGQTPKGTKITPLAGRDPFAAKPIVVAHPRLSKLRQDPFRVDWKLPLPPPYVFDTVQPIRLASDYVETPTVAPYEVREAPQFRVSGIMNGDGVYAILETSKGAEIIKPGSEVKTDIPDGLGGTRTYRVVSINSEMARLRSQIGKAIYIQDVPLTDVGIGGPTGGSPASSPGAFPGGGGAAGSTGGGGRPGGSAGGGAGRPGGGRKGGAFGGGNGGAGSSE